MNKIKLLLLAVILLSQFSCTSKDDVLKEKLNIYKECYRNKDYIKMSSLVLPSIIEEAGGPDKFVELMKSLPSFFESVGMRVDVSKLEFGEPNKIYDISSFSIAVVPTKLPIEMQNQKGYIRGSVICFSEDKGRTWFFIEGSDEGRSAIANTNPEIIQNLEIPTPTLIIGGQILHQRNGEWINDSGLDLGNTPPDFVEFMEKFTKDKKTQLGLIKFPLSNPFGKIPAPSKAAWSFHERSCFYEGEVSNNDGTIDIGHFEKLGPNKIKYGIGPPESEYTFVMIFEKNDNRWMLVGYWDLNMFSGI